MKAKIANLNHFQITFHIFLAWEDLVVGFTQKGLATLGAEELTEKENAGLVLIIKSE
ncbi:MAG: hypothetical protein LBF00_04115 [Mycoplasmataceae bacterium]|nr:hypothetical protein [Mycoplasmataceae bacterium]